MAWGFRREYIGRVESRIRGYWSTWSHRGARAPPSDSVVLHAAHLRWRHVCWPGIQFRKSVLEIAKGKSQVNSRLPPCVLLVQLQRILSRCRPEIAVVSTRSNLKGRRGLYSVIKDLVSARLLCLSYRPPSNGFNWTWLSIWLKLGKRNSRLVSRYQRRELDPS